MNFEKKLEEAQWQEESIKISLWRKVFFWWTIDSKLVKSIELRDWIKEEVNYHFLIKDYAVSNKSELVLLAQKLQGAKPYITIYNIEKWVYQNIIYITDKKQHGVVEKWQSAEETLLRRMGDCEDHMTLIHVLLRLAGIPSTRIYSCIGDANKSGNINHYWLLFWDTGSLENPRNRWVRLDTTYRQQVVPIHKKDEYKQGDMKIYYRFNENGVWRFTE